MPYCSFSLCKLRVSFSNLYSFFKQMTPAFLGAQNRT